MNSDSKRSLDIHTKYNDLLEPNTIIYDDKDCICFNCKGKKIIMNDRSKFTFIYISAYFFTFLLIFCSSLSLSVGVYFYIKQQILESLLVSILITLIFIIIIGFCLNYYTCLILEEKSVKIIKRKLFYKKTIIYDRFDLDRIELEYKNGGGGEGLNHYYYFNLFLTSGKKEIIYKLGTNNDNVNRETFDDLLNIVNLYIGAS